MTEGGKSNHQKILRLLRSCSEKIDSMNHVTAEVEEGTLDGFNCGRGKENIIKGRDMCAVTISETHPTMPAYLSNKWNDGEDQAFFEGSERTVKLKALLA